MPLNGEAGAVQDAMWRVVVRALVRWTGRKRGRESSHAGSILVNRYVGRACCKPAAHLSTEDAVAALRIVVRSCVRLPRVARLHWLGATGRPPISSGSAV